MPGSLEGNACRETLRDSGEFVLRLQTASNPTIPSHVTLGSSLIDGHGGGGVLITIDPGLVHTIASQAHADPSAVLGRAMAHEAGHLLIGTPTHSSHGLMRALWSQKELRADSEGDWLFSVDQIQVMQRGLTRDLGN